MPAIQTTTNICRYTSDLRAQIYVYENGNINEGYFCLICNTKVDPSGNCACGGSIDVCACSECGASITCGNGCSCQNFNESCYCDYCNSFYNCYSYHNCSSYNGPCYCYNCNTSYDCNYGHTCDSGSGGGGDPIPVCECCGENPCVCKICRCCNQKECICKCPTIEFTNINIYNSGFYNDYVAFEGWGYSYCGCNYNYVLCTQSTNFQCYATIKILNPSHNNDSNFSGVVHYYSDGVSMGTISLNTSIYASGGNLYSSDYTNIGGYNGTITNEPCDRGELEVVLSFSSISYWTSNLLVTVCQDKYQITTQIPKQS